MSKPMLLETAHGPLSGVVSVPGSKSIANRALVCAALADGLSTLRAVPSGDDTSAMVDCLRTLGVQIQQGGTTADVTGVAGQPVGGGVLNSRLAGTTSRFMTAVASLSAVPSLITGDEALCRRPMAALHDALTSLGAVVRPESVAGHLPVWVSGSDLAGGSVAIPGDVSSQYVTALMLIAPYLDRGLQIQLTSPLVSRPYVAITASVMSSFGVSGIAISDRSIGVEAGRYVGTAYDIEPDASSASYPCAAAAIVGGSVTVIGLLQDALQGDARFVEVLMNMGCAVVHEDTRTTVVGADELIGVEVDMGGMSDLVPTLAAVAIFASTPTRITGVGFIRHKESDRIGDLVDGLVSLGCDVTEEQDGLLIRPVAVENLVGTTLKTHDDHRLAMAWSLVALRVSGIVLDEPHVISKSWPEWWEVRSSLLATPGH